MYKRQPVWATIDGTVAGAQVYVCIFILVIFLRANIIRCREGESFVRWMAFCFRNNAIYPLLLYYPSFVRRKCRANVHFLFKKISHTPSSHEIGLKIIVFVPVEKITLLDRFIRSNITRHSRYNIYVIMSA